MALSEILRQVSALRNMGSYFEWQVCYYTRAEVQHPNIALCPVATPVYIRIEAVLHTLSSVATLYRRFNEGGGILRAMMAMEEVALRKDAGVSSLQQALRSATA